MNKLEQLPFFSELLSSGIIPVNLVTYKVIFEFYVKDLERLQSAKYKIKGVKRQAKENTAQEFNISERSVYLILEKMK